MDKVKIKNLILNNKKRSVMLFAILLIAILLVSIIVYAATNNEDYVVEIKDDGAENIAQNAGAPESSVTKKIVSETIKSLTYEVAMNNLKTRSSYIEVAVLLDTSSSMPINDAETQVRQKATQFIQGLFLDVYNVGVSISNNAAVGYYQGQVNYYNCANAINSFVEGQGSDLNNGIDNALSTFSAYDNEKYLIIFSDATDPVLEKLQNCTENGINVYSILTDMTNNEYKENATTVGNVQMISNIENFSPIYNKMNNSIINVKVKDIFTEETNSYFTLEEGVKSNDVTFTKTENGYELECANIKAGETKTVQFTLTLNENAAIDAGKIYRNLNTSSQMTINYDNYTGDKRNYNMKNSPIYVICKKYSLTIEAVSEKSNDEKVKDLDIEVVGTIVTGQDEEGNDIVKEVYNNTLRTDSKGKIKIDELKTLGDITFEIKPLVNQLGYSDTDATTIIVHNDPTGVGAIWAESDVSEPIADPVTRNIDVRLPILTQRFNIKVETVDLTNSNIKLGNIEYRLIQPKLNSKYEMEALYATTDENGNVTFRPTVMTKDGTYEYILSQLSEQEGYDGIGNVTLIVKFKDGKVTAFSRKHSENVEAIHVSETEGKVIVKNESENADTFRLEINVADSENSNKKLQGAIYNVEVTRVTSSGKQITNTVNGCITDENGQIKLDLPGVGNVQVRITEVNPATGYHQDTQTKKIVFSRTDGRVQLVTARDPIDLKAEPDSDANALVVKLTSVQRSGKNRIQIHMIDNDERDINIPGVGLTLVNLVTSKAYTAVSDGNGIANFLVDDEQPGIYAYDIMLTNGLPYGYVNSQNKLGGISVHFDDNKFIDECSDTGATVPYFSASYEVMDEDFSYHTGKVEIGLAPDAANSYNFQVKLVNDKNQNIQGAKYDITITSGDVVRTIKGRATDSNGMLTTRLVGGDEIEIRVKQTETIQGHIINTEEQIIKLTKINGTYQITHQEPYIYDGNTQKIGAIMSGNNVIYFDVNTAKTENDTRLNLYINKIDTDNNLVGGVKTVITSPTLKLAGNAITPETNYSATAKSGNVFTLNPAVSDNNGYFEIEGIEVNGLELNDGERVDYMYMYEIDVNGNKVPNTDVTLKLTFRFNENKRIIQITNVEATWGNRLISKRTFDGFETNVAYESNVYLDIYTNYDDVGNFSLDLSKTDKDNNPLQGAKYDVIVTRLDGTRVVRRGIEITDSVEFAGLLVAQGTKIEITEVEAPIGYELNEYTEILTITNIEAVTGKITVQLEKGGYATPRAELKPVETLILEDGTYKTCASLQLMDYELATFKFGIKAEDSTTGNPIGGYKFRISSSQGAQNNTEPTNANGKAVAIVGANYEIEGFKVTYTVDTLKVANYYKKLKQPIDVIVVFDLNGEVKTSETIAENEANKEASGYGTIWEIENTNDTANGGNDIEIKVKIEPEDKLTVNIASIDRRTNNIITGNEYKITPSINLPGTGTTQIDVGYVISDGMNQYTIEQTVDNMKYEHLENQTFKVEYDSNGNITKVDIEDPHYIIRETHNGKVLNLTIAFEPITTVKIISQDRISKAIVTENEYKVIPSSDRVDSNSVLDKTTQEVKSEVGYAEPDTEVKYTLTQTNDLGKYEVIDDQTFTVTYDADDKITDITEVSDKIIENTHTDGEITLTLELEPILPVTVNIVTKDIISKQVLHNIEYELSLKEHTQGEGTTKIKDNKFTAGTGTDNLEFNCAIPNGTGKYLLKQTNEVNRYVVLDDMEFELEYDSDDNIIKAQSNSDKLEISSFTGRTLNIEVKVEPGVPFEITNIGYFDNLPLSNAEFEITSATPITKTATTDVSGVGIQYVDKLGENETVVYKIKQTGAARTYCTVEEFEIEVTYDANRYITDAKLREGSTVNEYVTFVTVSHTNPSTTNDRAYNGNDRGIVNIEVKNYPAVQFEITNVDRQDNTKVLNGTGYKVTSSAEEEGIGTTMPTAVVYVGRGDFSKTITYTITETSPAARYQKQLIDSVIEVDFDNQGIIRAARIIKNGDITTVSLPGTTTYTDSRKVNVQIESNPQLAISITKIDEDSGAPVQGVDFEVIAQIEKQDLQNYDEEKLNKIMQDTTELSEESYLEEALYRLKQTKDDIENIKQTIALNKIINELKESNNLTADEENKIMQGISFSQKANIIANMGKRTITEIFQTVDAITIREVANKLIEDNVTTQDAINDIVAEIKDLVRLNVNRVTTNQNGNATAYMDKTLESKTIEYTLRETKKAPGYDWADETVRFEVTYDEKGKMVANDPIKVISGNFDIVSYNADEFSIETTIRNTPSKEVKIHVIAEDVYDNDKKLETAKFDAFLIDQNATNSFGELTFAADNNYRTSLSTGSIQNAAGEITHGEDTQSIGVYEGAAGARILRLVEKETPSTAYIGNTSKSISYKSTPYAMLVRVAFDDEGHVTSAGLYNPGGDSRTIGDIVDSRYMTVSWAKNTIEITVKYYPMLKVQMVTKDMYTEQALRGSYRIDTNDWSTGYNGDNRIQSGYIDTHYNSSWKFGADYSIAYTTDASLPTNSTVWSEEELPENLYGASKVAIAPTEAESSDSRERIFNIFEMSEPTSGAQYQKYRNWYLDKSDQRLIGKFKVVYNEKGELQTATLVRERSTNNITSGFIEITPHIEDDYTVQITVKYAPITTISAKVIDAVSGQGISGIRIEPYQYNTSVSNYPYEYRRTNWYYVTGASGTTGWTYWGGSIADGKVYYQMSTSNYYTRMVGGYFNPGAILLEVSYDGEGRVSAVEVKSTDQFGDPNAIDVSWNRNNNNISITIPYQRQFLLDIGKVNYDDNTNKLSGAMFRVESSKGVLTEFNGNSGRHVVGKVYAGKTIRYTITETQYPANYTSVGTMYVDVEFNNDGTIRKTTSSEPDYYEYVNQISIKDNVSSGMKINIKNKLAFIISLDVRDKFYPTLGVEGATYEITNDKKDNAAGTLITDKNGRISVTVGTIYKNETVKYTIKQKNKANGYYINTQEIEVEVKFNKSGGIDTVSIIKGQNVVTSSGKVIFNSLDAGVFITTFNMPEDIKVGIEKYDKLDNSVMADVKFNVKVEPVGKVEKDYNLVTNANGTVVDIVDKFEESNDYKKVKYTISEIEVPNSYRKIEDVQIEITYNKDGSMLLYDTISNPSNVEIAIATNKQIGTVDGIPTHIKLRIPNDNAYDLIIKNEDIDYPKLGIEGTIYDVTINGEEITPAATDVNGITRIANRTEVGKIEIRIAERTPGEGYREEPNNDATIVFNKGTDVYSLVLDETELTNKGYTFTKTEDAISGDTTYEIVIAQRTVEDQIVDIILTLTVNENYGTISATFKNETKLELNIVKDDINTGELLEGAIFAITSEELDNTGNVIEDTLKTITNTHSVITGYDEEENPIITYEVDAEERTNKEGLLHFDLKKAHQNKTIKYTLTEVVAPENYTEISPIEVIVKFDMYGRITDITDNSFRAECYLDSNTGKSHNMIFNISNGTVDPQYSIKVVSQDSQTGTRINGSIFQVEVKDSEEATYKEVTGTTRDVNKTVGNRTFVSERGVMKVTGIKAEGDITISVNQVETATGYVYGKNTVAGDVLANAKFIVSATDLDKDLELTVTDDAGFDVTVDNTNREITIRVKNDPELTFDITKIDGKTKEKLEGAEFTVTSIMQTSATTVETTLNETSSLTDEDGHTTLNGGIIQAGRTMIYTLKENKLEGYDQLDDIVILVQYDTKGNIMYYEILSDVNDARVIVDKALVDANGNVVKDEQGNIQLEEEAKILETKRILGESDVPGIVEIDFQTYKIPTGIGTKKLQLEVSNTPESPNDNDGYQVIIEKHHIDNDVYTERIPGVTFEIKVTQEYGKAETAWIDTTDNTGIIKSPYFEGYGYITVEIKEIATIEGFKLDSTVKTITFIRDKETHDLSIVNVNPENIGYELSLDNTQVILRPVNEIASNTYNMIINKVDKNTNTLITNNSAEFEIYRIDKYENITEVENEETGEITYESEIQEIKQLVVSESTGETGRILANNLKAPEEEGTYRYVIKETKAPEGYILPTEEMELDVTFTKNESDELIITKVEVVKGNDNIKVAEVRNQLFNLIVLNENEKDIVQDGEYSLNVLKVDKDKNAILTDTAIFKLTNMQTNEVNYYETNEQGKLEIPTFKMPEEAGKYIYKLNEVKAPNGYVLNVNDIMLELEFAKDEEGKMYLKDVQVQGDNIEYETPEEGELPDTTITIKVINEEGGNGTGNTNDKRYTFVLNKVDSLTKEIISQNVEFEVMLANGEMVKGKTNDAGQLRIEDVFMPAKPGEYELVIKEITTPSGYKVDTEPKNVKVTFTGYGDDMVISDIKLGDTNNKNIEILQDKCSEQYIEVNILNEKDNYEKLYVVSKKYQEGYDLYDKYLKDKNAQSQIYKEGEEIYQVLDGFYGVEGYKNPHYRIDKPFIDTKIAKYKSYVLAEEFIGNLESNGYMEVLGYDGNPIGPKDHVGTGMTLRSTLGDQELTFTIVVKGDSDYKDEEKTKIQIGRVDTKELDKLSKHLSKETIITDPIALRALDIDFDGRVRTTDLDKMYELLSGRVYYDYFQNGIDKSDIKYVQP